MTYKELIKQELIEKYGKSRWGLYYGNTLRQAKSYTEKYKTELYGKSESKNLLGLAQWGIITGKEQYRFKGYLSEISGSIANKAQVAIDLARTESFRTAHINDDVVGENGKIIELSPYKLGEMYKNGLISREEFLQRLENWKQSDAGRQYGGYGKN